MSGILDFMRAALPGAVAARGGYMQGEDERRSRQAAVAKQRRMEQQAAAKAQKDEERQSMLDQMTARLREAELEKTRAEIEKLRKPEAEKPTPAPTSRSTSDGIEEWDPVKKIWVKTGKTPYRAPPAVPASERPAALEKAKKQETKDALSGVSRQIDDTRANMSAAERNLPKITPSRPSEIISPVDSAAHRKSSSLIGKMRQRLDSLTAVGDSLNAELKKPSTPVALPRGPGGGRGGGGNPVDPIDAKLTDDQIIEAMRAGAKTDDAVRAYWRNKKP